MYYFIYNSVTGSSMITWIGKREHLPHSANIPFAYLFSSTAQRMLAIINRLEYAQVAT